MLLDRVEIGLSVDSQLQEALSPSCLGRAGSALSLRLLFFFRFDLFDPGRKENKHTLLGDQEAIGWERPQMFPM
jgi:hypothetical protein